MVLTYSLEILLAQEQLGPDALFEINGSRKRNNANYKEQWLKDGDKITMIVEGLGKLQIKLYYQKVVIQF